jgi:hypothetical protein
MGRLPCPARGCQSTASPRLTRPKAEQHSPNTPSSTWSLSLAKGTSGAQQATPKPTRSGVQVEGHRADNVRGPTSLGQRLARRVGSRAPSRHPTGLQAVTVDRTGRVAGARRIGCCLGQARWAEHTPIIDSTMPLIAPLYNSFATVSPIL